MGMTPEFLANLKKATENFKGKGDYAKLISKAGEFYDFDIDIVSPDPNQPRKNFDEAALQELADDLKKNGLIQPIVVREDPDNVGKFIVVAGERRLKAAKLAGFKKIRSILSTYDNSQLGYVQIAENAKRDNLKFYEMAEFIVSRSDAGEKQADIAEKLGLSKTKLSEFMIWKDAPELLKDAKEKFNAIRAFYDAVKLYEEHPDEISDFIEKNENISKSDISNFRKKLTEQNTAVESSDSEAQNVAQLFEISSDDKDSTSLENDSTEDSFEEPANASDYESDDTEEESSEATTDDFSSDDSAESAEISNSAPTFQDEAFSGVDTSINESESESLADTDFDSETKSKKLKHPVFVGTVDGREAEIVMEMPTTDGMVKVKYEDGSLDEVLCENFILNRIYES
ncbi:ParB/RepB/Spo0J family partition protein [Succinivibrio faecicola]|uniref:ParB/RepB/Spo0J family partition protein n=1 Tax=Succinivibrio faecicola TaxID=2820300 RepID=A0ABS7DGQ7_9GAMM|nr:ParB/RepB/Spo0J family partition protein [Succinivibrio faecicola]MBW7570291.1 ParB/RepB/Spo0J family partition protein [Succinivibrio faecicola]